MQRQTDASLDVLVNMIEHGGIPGFYPVDIVEEITLLCIEEKNIRAEGYLRNMIRNIDCPDYLRIMAFFSLTKKLMPAGLVSKETLEELTKFENNPANTKMLAIMGF